MCVSGLTLPFLLLTKGHLGSSGSGNDHGLTIHSSRTRFAGRLNSGVRGRMKRLAALIATSALAGCLALTHERQLASPLDVSGSWYSGSSLNATNYTLHDCRYERGGAFHCMTLDKGCSGTLCEFQSFPYSGTWKLEGFTLTRRTTQGWGPEETSWSIREQRSGVLYFTDGTRWYRTKRARDKDVIAAL
jgi:hypothetical protein